MKSFIRATLTVGSYTSLSRFLGLIRDMLMATFMGATPHSDAFFVAFRLPNLFRQIFAEGAFSSSFIPFFTRMSAKTSEEKAMDMARDILSVLMVFLCFFVILFEIFLPQIIPIMTPGFSKDPSLLETTIMLSRITFPYILLISWANFYVSVLNSLSFFQFSAAMPLFMNLFLIAGGCLSYGLGWSLPHTLGGFLVLSGCAQVLWMMLALKKATPHGLYFQKPKAWSAVKNVFSTMMPSILTAGMGPLNMLVGTMVASFMGGGTISCLFYAERFMHLPSAIIGTALGTTLLAFASRARAQSNPQKTERLHHQALFFGMALTLPAMVGLMVFAHPIIGLFFASDVFQGDDVHQTATLLKLLAPSLPAHVCAKIFMIPFFSRENTKTPAVLSALSMGIHAALNGVFFYAFPSLSYQGIALASTLSAWTQAFFLGWALYRGGLLVINRPLIQGLGRLIPILGIFLAAMAMMNTYFLPFFLDGSKLLQAGGLGLLIILAVLLYGGICWCLGVDFRKNTFFPSPSKKPIG